MLKTYHFMDKEYTASPAVREYVKANRREAINAIHEVLMARRVTCAYFAAIQMVDAVIRCGFFEIDKVEHFTTLNYRSIRVL